MVLRSCYRNGSARQRQENGDALARIIATAAPMFPQKNGAEVASCIRRDNIATLGLR